MLKVFLSSAVLVATCSSAFAQQSLDPESIIVSATRIPTPANAVASSVTVIDAAEIEARQQRSLPDVLRDVPGLSLIQTGGMGGQTSLFLRGANANHTKVLVDGIDIADPASPNGAADISKYLSADIARVEVLRGPSSGLYGSDAIGGVVSITTKRGEGPTTFSGSLEGGSFATFNQRASLSGADRGFSFAASLDHVHAGATAVTPLDLLLPGEKRNADYYDGINASAKIGYAVTGDFDLGLVTRYGDALAKITGDAFSLATFTSYPSPVRTRLNTQTYQSRGTAHWKGAWFDQTLGLAYSSTAASDMDPNNGSFPSSGNRIKLDWQGNVALGEGEILVLGAETGRDAIHIPIKAGTSTSAGFAELQSAIGSFSNSASIRYDDNSRFGGHATWRLAPALVLGGTKLKGSIGTAFKAPSLENLFQSFPAFGFFANPALKPETSTGYDAGIEQRLGDLSAGVTWFHNDIKNLIANNASFSMDINIGRATTQGVEAFLGWKPSEVLLLRADYTYTDAIDDVAHLQLVRRPRHKASLNADWQLLPALGLNASLLFVGPQIDGNRDFSNPRLKMPGYTLLNLAANWRVDGNFTLFGRVENAFDTRYQSPDGFLRPGIGLFAGIRANL